MADDAVFDRMVALFTEELKLCKVQEGETLGVLSVDALFTDYRHPILQAARSLGAHAIDVHLERGSYMNLGDRMKAMGANPLNNDRESLERLKQCDIVIDLVFLLFSEEQIEIERSGTRILLVIEPFEVIERLFPTPELYRRVKTSARMLREASTFRFTNEAGTDILFELGENRILDECGHADEPGRWDNMTGGFVATYATAGVNGKVVMAPGDVIYPWKEYVRSPLTFIVENSRIVKIDGGEDGERLSAFMASYKDERAYAISHIGWGLSENARWDKDIPGAGSDPRSFVGNVLFSTGPNLEFGGDNNTACHLDLPMRNCDAYLDDELIIKRGTIIHKAIAAV